jgi:hypothetical protein
MADFSLNTEQLTAMANELNREAGNFQDDAIPKVHKLAIPAYEFPLFAIGFASSYEQLHRAADEAVRALHGTMASMGTALTRVASYYQQMETKQGADFDTGAQQAASIKVERHHHG